MSSQTKATDLPTDGVGLDRICGHLLRRSQQVHAVIWADEVGAGITSPQYGVLAVLRVHGRMSQRRLGELAFLDKSSTADVVGRLADRMWISRSQDPDDARANVLALTPAAEATLARLTSSARRVQERLLQPLDAHGVPSFIRRLRLVSRLEGAEPASERPSADPTVLQLDVPGHLIRRAQRVHQSVWFKEFGRVITGPQYAALYVLAKSPDINQRHLGALAALDRSTGADVIDRLVRRGWIVRRRDPADGRGHLLRLSEPTASELEGLAGRVDGVQEQLLAPLDRVERDRLLEDLAAIAPTGASPDEP